MGNPIPAITEVAQENLASWAPESPSDFAELVSSLPVLLEALHGGLAKAVQAADPNEALASDVHGDLEAVLRGLETARGSAVDADETFTRAYGFWLGRD